MADKKTQYYDLDDIGVIGVTEKRSPEEVRRDAEEMASVIRAYKLEKASAVDGSVSTLKGYNRSVAIVVRGNSQISKGHSSPNGPTTTK